jgi:hypothetical protein
MERTIQIYGYGFSDQFDEDQQAEIRVRIDGETIYHGPVLTPGSINDILPGSKDFPLSGPVVGWQQSLAAASRQLEITPLVGNFCFTATRSDYMPIRLISDLATEWSSGPGHFVPCYALQEEEFVYFRDSNHNVMINGELQPRVSFNDWERLGQWHWTIMQNQTFSSTMLISAGLDAPVLPVDDDNPWDDTLKSYLIWRLNHDPENLI